MVDGFALHYLLAASGALVIALVSPFARCVNAVFWWVLSGLLAVATGLGYSAHMSSHYAGVQSVDWVMAGACFLSASAIVIAVGTAAKLFPAGQVVSILKMFLLMVLTAPLYGATLNLEILRSLASIPE